MKGTENVTETSSFGTTNTITHNLGYIPFIRLYVNYPDLSGIRSVELQPYNSVYIVHHDVTSTQLKIGITNNTVFDDSDGSVVPFYYRIYAEPQ